MSRPVVTMAQYSNPPSTRPVGRICFAEDVTEIKPTATGAVTSSSTPHRKLSIQEDLDPPRSSSDTTHLRPILTNRNVQSNSTGPKTATSLKFGPSSKPLPRIPFGSLNSQVQPNAVNHTPAVHSPSGAEEAGYTHPRILPRDSLSVPLAISQRAGFKWPRPEGINVAKANETVIPPAPNTAPASSNPSLMTSKHSPHTANDNMDEKYAAKGYSWARPKPLRLSNAPIAPSENQFAQAAQASHHAAMTAALDTIHQRISSLDERSHKLCSSIEKLTTAVEKLTERMDASSVLTGNMASNYTANKSYGYSTQPSSVRPSVVESNFLNPTSTHSQSPRLSEATLHGIQTPTSMKAANIFAGNPFDVRIQSHDSAMSGMDQDEVEVNELMRKRSGRGRQQSCWDPETDEEDEGDEKEEVDEHDYKSEYNENPTTATHQHNASTDSWTSITSPLTAMNSTYHDQTAGTGTQAPNLPALHENRETSSLQSSPPRSDDSHQHRDAENESHAEQGATERKYSAISMTPSMNEPIMSIEQSGSNEYPLMTTNSASTRSSAYSIASDSTPQPPAFLSGNSQIPASSVPTPTPTPVNVTIASALHNLKSTPSPVSQHDSPFPRPPFSSVTYTPSSYVNNSADYAPSKFQVTNNTRSSSLSNRSYSSSISSHLETTTPVRPAWYFFYGALLDPSLLTELLHLSRAPNLYRARVWGCSLRYYGAYPAAVPTPEDSDKCVEGAAWYVPEKDMVAWLRSHEEGEGRMVEVEANIDFLERIPEIDRFGANDGMAKGRIFVWKGDVDGLMDHPII